jgi:aspartyl-tRNA synthetase
MHPYRTHRCGDLRRSDVGGEARLSGWVHRKRDHGQLLFVDLRDHAGVAQLVFQPGTEAFTAAEGARLESVLTVTGEVVARSPETVNRGSARARSRSGSRTAGSSRRPRRCRCR